MADAYVVAIVVSENRPSEVVARAKVQPVWAVRSPAHERVAAALWADASTSPDFGLTLFNGGGPPEDDLVSNIRDVDEHHGEFSHDPPVSVIEVVGARCTPAVAAAFAEYGFTKVVTTEDGFTAYRSA